jgi:LPS-assembly lipoprotein
MEQPKLSPPAVPARWPGRRTVLRRLGQIAAGGLILSLAACGFELRKTPSFAFKTIYANVAPTSVFGTELKRNLAAIGNVTFITDPAEMKDAEVILDILQDQREKVVVGVGATGQVREFQLRLRVKFKLRTPQGKELIPETELLRQLDISFSESAALSKEAEEGQLYRSMQTDVVQQLMRRLAAVKEL